tara:strand:+ start:2752 stop:3954 length:1203 start_codon:yes stop_codon:yes gene_type:complete
MGLPLFEIIDSIKNGFGNTLKSIGLIIVFSIIMGEFLKESGSIKMFGNLILSKFKNNSILSLNFLGLFLGIVVFCDSGFLILNSISKSIVSSSNISLASLNLSLSGGLYTSHTLIPPTPGPLAAISNLNANQYIGYAIIIGSIVSIPSSLISFFYAKKFSKNIQIDLNKIKKINNKKLILPFLVILTPTLLIGSSTFLNIIELNENSNSIFQILKILGNPLIAISIGTIICFLLPSKSQNNKKKWIQNSLKISGPILILTSLGGAFGEVLKNSDLSNIINQSAINLSLSPIYILFLSFIVCALLKTSQGSSTSSLIIGSSILFPILQSMNISDPWMIALIVASLGSGAMTVSHANDSYFWIVTQSTSLNISEGYKKFTLMTLLQGIASFITIIAIYIIII